MAVNYCQGEQGLAFGTDSVDLRRKPNKNFGKSLFVEKLNYLAARYVDFQTSASFSYVLHTMLDSFMQHRIPKKAVAFIPRRTPQIVLKITLHQYLHKHVESCTAVGQSGGPTHYLHTDILTYLI
jgi:hypothetical protein